MKAYFLRVSAWLSQGVNCVLLFGHHDQTVSARCYVNRFRQPWAVLRVTIDRVVYAVTRQRDHCRESHGADVRWAKEVLRDG